jgi:hypothetical protein
MFFLEKTFCFIVIQEIKTCHFFIPTKNSSFIVELTKHISLLKAMLCSFGTGSICQEKWRVLGSKKCPLVAGFKVPADTHAVDGITGRLPTCKLNNIDVNEYLSDVLMRLPLRPANSDISDLMPVGWHKAKNGGEMPPVTHLYPSKN